MPQYPFETQLVISPDATGIVVVDADVTIYDPSDTAMASPLDLLDPYGLPMENPLRASEHGFIPAFSAPIPEVMWVGGGFAGYINSFKGLLAEVVAARLAAEAATVNGIPRGGATGQVLAKTGGADFAANWVTQFVVIGPTDAWPTGLPDGTIVVRSEV